MTKPQTFNADLTRLPSALLPLTEQERWVCWNWEFRKKWTKPPRQARAPGRYAKSNDPRTWSSYSVAVDVVLAGKANGIGYMLHESDIGAGDLDHSRDPTSGTIDPWASQLCDEANGAYREVTVSGRGLRIIGKANGTEVHRKFTFDRTTGAGLELYRNTPRFITISGQQIGDCAELPPLDDFINSLVERYDGERFDGKQERRSDDYDDIIRNGAPKPKRSSWFHRCVWHLAGKGLTAEQIGDELAKYPNGIAAKYAGRLQVEVERSYQKWRAHKQASVTGRPATGNWPEIYIVAGELPRVVNEAESALLDFNREIYQRGELVVRPVQSKLRAHDGDTLTWQLAPVTQPYLVETLTKAARFLKFDGRAGGYVPTDAPDKVAETYLSRYGDWKLPILTGITNAPFLRSDWSLCERPGYDPTSGLLFHPDGQSFPAIPVHPSKADAVDALDYLKSLIKTFPFVAEADRAVALSGILTALDRRAMATAPLHAFTSPVAGTGKSLLADIAAMIATGQPAPVISQGRGEEELEKRLGTALMTGDAIIAIDNCEHPLESALLCQALSQLRLKIRVLGQSRHVEVPINATFFATGNNFEIAGDLTRRTLLGSIDAQCERPELREFKVDVREIIHANRGKLVAAALTILRAWHLTGEDVELSPFGSFEQWSRRIRAPLFWLGCADPCVTVVKVRDNDPRRAALSAVLVQWEAHLGANSAVTVRQIIDAVAVKFSGFQAVPAAPEFEAALIAVAAAPGSGKGPISHERLGRWLRKVEGKIVNNLSLIKDGVKDGYTLWKLVRVP